MSPNNFHATTIDLLRHGACEGGNIYRGTTDSPLNLEGWQQMTDSLANFSGWQHIITSPLQRCQTFAASFAHKKNLQLTLEPGFRELDFGVWEGREVNAIWAEDPDTVEAYYRQPGTITPAGGESLGDARQRLNQAWINILTRFTGKHLLIVTHGGSIRLLLTLILGAPLTSCQQFHIPYGSFSRIRIDPVDGGNFARLILHQPGDC